jgi:maleylacetate reductase
MSISNGEIVCTATESVIYGQPAASAISEQAERYGAQRVFLLVSDTLNRTTDEIEKVRKVLGERLAGEFSGILPHVPRTNVIKAAQAARAVNADLIVSIGGGSVVDAGKMVLLCLKHQLHEHDDFEPYHVFINDNKEVVKPTFEGPDIRLICVPTTLSGGEFNPLAGATDEKIKMKQGYEHRLMAPISVILDPALTVHTPQWLWMSTGVRSLDHAFETLGSLLSNDYCDGVADSAIQLLVEGLARVKADPSDLEARLKCQIGVWQSMIPVVAGVPMGASHAIGHVLGGTLGVPHGYTSCVMAPFVLQYNQSVNEHRQQRISQAMGDKNQSAWSLVEQFIRNLGMPRSLGEVNVDEDDLLQVAHYTMDDFWARTNPRPINDYQDILEILKLAL